MGARTNAYNVCNPNFTFNAYTVIRCFEILGIKMIEIKKIEIDGEIVNISKTDKPFFAKWHIVYPIKNEDGSINWKHLITGGTWGNLIFTILFVLVFLGAAWEYNQSLKECAELMGGINDAYSQGMSDSMKLRSDLNPLVDNMRLIPNITLEVNITE